MVGGNRSGNGTDDTATDDGIAMALLAAAQDLAEVKARIETLVNTHAMRRGVSLAVE
jgi:hypothetical protein